MLKSFTFNGIKKPYVTVLSRKRKYWAPVRRQYITQTIGARLRKTNTEIRVEEVKIEIAADSFEELRGLSEDLANWLITDEEKPLVFDDEPDRTYMALIEGTFSPDEIVSKGYGLLTFICMDPYKIGATRTLQLTNVFQTFEIQGHVQTNWSCQTTFTSTATQFVLESNQGGKVIVNFNFVPGDVLTIDYKERKIFINGNLKMTTFAMESVWFPLKPGSIQLKASRPTVLTYQEKFR